MTNKLPGFLLKLLIVAVVSAVGIPALALLINILLLTDIIPPDIPETFGNSLITKAMFIWIFCVLVAIVSIFVKSKWRYLLLLAPVYLPSVFAIIYSLSAR